jgi:hypothetical protein
MISLASQEQNASATRVTILAAGSVGVATVQNIAQGNAK